jgi:hypothetical protein
MRRLPSYLARAFAVLLLLTATAPLTPSQDPPPPKCCFTNPSYAGTCEVEPAKDETCGSILGYLNNPMSQGKGYCGNTTIRGGWQSVVCEPKQ